MPLAESTPLVAYPAGLPSPLRDGYGLTPTSPLRRSTMVSGRTRSRRLYNSVPTVAAVRWLFSDAEAQLFESWFDEKIDSGAAWFECPLRVPGGMGRYKARFVDIYEGPNLVGVDHWSFTANLELWERPILRGWSDFPEQILGSPIIDLAINREWPE